MKSTSVQKLLLASFLILIPLALWQTVIWAERLALDQLRRNAVQNLNLVVRNLRAEQEKFRALTRLIARNPTFRNLLNGTLSEDEIATLNLSLEQISAFTDAMAIYIMDRSGQTIAASNWNTRQSFIGKNFSYRPYFDAAMQGRLGRYFAIGTTSGQRGYYFAYPIRSAAAISGALVIKMDVSHLESLWWSHDFDIIVTDPRGVIFLSTKPEWVFKSLTPLDEAQRERIRASRQYAAIQISSLNASPGYSFGAARDLISIPVTAGDGQITNKTYLRHKASIAEARWDITILSRTDRIRPQILIAAGIMGVLLVSLGLLSAYMFERRRRIQEQIILQKHARETLEEKVRLRTDDLAQANEKLRTQIAERSRAESQLRRTQKELIQASRMAALGQVSAGLSHELNQPLAAIRSYADNARAYLARSAPEKAISNLSGISELTDRMARIIGHLRTYARKDTVKPYPTPVAAMIDEALALHQPRLKEKAVEVTKNYPRIDPLALAG
ncbi:MAG TPA: sensor histidine kinase, partial [Rhizobiales bacterium]|nr:sensor histidine kinase [Hyphomicrobiales bacterium]